jgi:FRG domain
MLDEIAKSLSEFIEKVRKVRQSWAVPDDKELWFRGEDKIHQTALRPKLYRPAYNGRVKRVDELLKIEIEFYNSFQDYGLQLCTENFQEEHWYWDWYFLMQHHGVPTRLLDWSDGSLIALHFAVRHKRKDNIEDAAVYIVEPDRLTEKLEPSKGYRTTKQRWRSYIKTHDEFTVAEWDRSWLPPEDDDDAKELPVPKLPCVLHTSHITRRVAAQRSRFVVFGSEPDWLYREFQKRGSVIQRIVIHGPSIYGIKKELRESGVTESVIFPDLDGLGREMDQLWQDRQ